jgi:hypothetical protein
LAARRDSSFSLDKSIFGGFSLTTIKGTGFSGAIEAGFSSATMKEASFSLDTGSEGCGSEAVFPTFDSTSAS